MSFNRRTFIKGLAAAGASGVINPHFTFAQSQSQGKIRNLVSIFLRGGADGLTLFPYLAGPLEPIVRQARPNTSILPAQIISLGGMNQSGRNNILGFHPEWGELLSKVHQTNAGLSIITEYGVTKDNSFSHEVAQSHFDSGTNLTPQTLERGWLANLVDTYKMPAFSTWGIGESSPLLFNAHTERPIVVASLGSYSFLDRNFGSFTCSNCANDVDKISSATDDSAFKRYIEEKLVKEAHPEISLDDVMTKSIGGLYSSVDVVQNQINPIAVDINQFRPASGQTHVFQQQMADIARVIRYANSPQAPEGVQNSAKIICTQIASWDSHANILGNYAYLIRILAGAVKGLIHHLNDWDLLSSTVIQFVTDFGRTTAENAQRGADHGWGNRFMVIGGPVARGVFGPEASVQEAGTANYFTPQVAFTGVQRQILKACGFSTDSLDQIFKVKLPGEMELPFII